MAASLTSKLQTAMPNV